MKPFILAGQYGLNFERSGRADAAVPFSFRFVDGMLPPPDELACYVAPLTKEHGRGAHWSVYTRRWHDPYQGRKSLGLVEFCEPFETVELWFDPAPNDQLQLVWLLDLLGSHPEIVAKLKLRLVDFDLLMAHPEELARWKRPAVDVTRNELETASLTWQAYRAATPEACFAMLARDLSALPLLRPALLDLLEELPSSTTGLGATEMRMLELIARGYERTSALSHLRSLSQRLSSTNRN